MRKKNIVRTSEITTDFCFENIARDFDIIEISIREEADFDEKKHISGKIIDIVDFEFPASAVVYVQGRSIFCLYPKEGVDCGIVQEQIQQNLEIDVAVKLVHAKDLYRDTLLQLLCNSLKNEDWNKYHNISGSLFYLTEVSTQNRGEICALRIKFSSFQKFNRNLNVELRVATFTSLKQLKYCYHGKEWQEIQRKPKYIIDSDGNFRRKLKSDCVSEDEIYVEKVKTDKSGKRSNHGIPFLKFNTLAGFSTGKMGVYYQLMGDILCYLSEYVTVENCHVFPKTLKEKNSKSQLFKNEKEYFKSIDEKGVHILNLLYEESQLTEEFVAQMMELLRSMGVSNITYGTERALSRHNIVLIHTPDYYKNNEIEDPHDATSFGQHIIFENHLANKEVRPNISTSAMRKILYELLIREDVLNHQLTLYQWAGFEEDVCYARHEHIKDEVSGKKYLRFHVLTIAPNGSMSYELVEKETNGSLYQQLCKHMSDFKNRYYRESDLEMIIYDTKDVVYLVNNQIVTIPDLAELYDRLKKYSKDLSLSKEELFEMLDSFAEEYPMYSQNIVEIKQEAENRNKNEFTYVEICNGSKRKEAKKVIPLIFLTGKNLSKDLVLYAMNKYDRVLNPLLKNESSKEIMLDAVMDINYFSRTDDDSDQSIYYFVGSKNSPRDAEKIEKACHVRHFCPATSDNILIKKLLEQLNVDFVRLGEYTVYPFPNKYLMEYKHLMKQGSK